MHGLKNSLIKSFKIDGVILNPDWLYTAFNKDHPSLYERIKAIPES
jgi:Zn-dependent protease with chaperone function